MSTILEAALRYAILGFKVFPVDRNKKPLTEHSFKDASMLQSTIREFWRDFPDANVAIVCDGLLVLDFDGKIGLESKTQLEAKFGKLPPTWAVRTGGGTVAEPKEQGEQVIYCVPTDLNIRPGVGKYGYPNLDIRANDSYIVAVPSVTRLPYETLSGSPSSISAAPDWVIKLATAKKIQAQPTQAGGDSQPILEGQRNATLASLAGTMRKRGMPQEAITAALLEVNFRQCQPPLSEADVNRIAQSISRYPPGQPSQTQGGMIDTRHLVTDSGNAERLVRLYGEHFRYVKERKRWLIWNGRYWEFDDGILMASMAKKTAMSIYHEASQIDDDQLRKDLGGHAKQSESEHRLAAMINLAKSEAGIAISVHDLDRNEWLLNARNGTINLKTGHHQPHTPADLITRMIDLDFNPDARSEEWERFVFFIFGGNERLVTYVHRALGYSITRSQAEQVFFFCHGSGENGKTTLLGSAGDILGPYATEIDPSAFMVTKQPRGTGPNESIATLHRVNFAYATELEQGQRLSTSLVKRMTGGEKLWCERKYESGYNFQPEYKLWLNGNHEPEIADTTHSLWRRLKKIPFNVTISADKKVKDFRDILVREHGQAILAWLVQGCLEWQRHGLGEPPEVTAATTDYREREDILHDFLAELCVLSKDATITVAELYKTYKDWCVQNQDDYPLGKNKFGNRLREKGLTTFQGNANRMAWHGIRLKTEEEKLNKLHLLPVSPETSIRGYIQEEFRENHPTNLTDLTPSVPGGNGHTPDYPAILGMPVGRVLTIWRAEGAPVVNIGPGENVQDLALFLGNADIQERHLVAIKTWLSEHQPKEGVSDGT